MPKNQPWILVVSVQGVKLKLLGKPLLSTCYDAVIAPGIQDGEMKTNLVLTFQELLISTNILLF